jgi:hypothetical protein
MEGGKRREKLKYIGHDAARALSTKNVRTSNLFPRYPSSAPCRPSQQFPTMPEADRASTQPKKDEREWTTFEQKAYLQSKQTSYAEARDAGNLRVWFFFELNEYFKVFPTLPVTVGEGVLHGPSWTMGQKRQHEEKVSVDRDNISIYSLMHVFTEIQGVVQESQPSFEASG